MEMFNVGGLRDEGGTKDPVSGNNVPSGSLKEEVRDDIDAKLSPGEFVFPADVTRFLGLRFLMELRDKAKAGLQRMEDMGQMGNSEEAVLDEDVPFEQSDLIIVAGSPMEEQMNKMNIGGMPIRASNGTAVPTYGPSDAPTYSTTGRGNQLLGSNLRQYFNPTTQEIRSVLVSRDNLTGELKPVSPLEEGFILDTPENRTKAMETQPQQTSARVETTRPKKERSSMPGGPAIGDIGVSEMTTTEKSDLADYYDANPIAASLALNIGNIATMSTTQVNPMVAGIQEVFGVRGKGVKAQGTLDRETLKAAQAEIKAMTPAQRAEQRERDLERAADRATRDYMDSVGASDEMRDDTVSVMGTIGGIPGPLSVDLDTEVVTDPLTGDIIGGRDGEKAVEKAKERQAKAFDRAFSTDPTSPDPTSAPPAAGFTDPQTGNPMGQSAGPPSGPPSGATGTGPDDDGTGAGSATGVMNIGGLASKPKKKKQKKKKRGGLASR